MKLHRLITAACVLTVATIVPCAAHAQTPIRFSGAAALSLPVGDLGNSADAGLNLALRGEGRISDSNWSVRGDLSWDRFAGHGGINSYSYFGAAGNMVHRSRTSRVYEFGGLGMYGSRTAFTSAVNQDATNVGAQMGIGIDLDPGPHTPFVEFGATQVFNGGNGSIWFPVRFGIRF